MLVICGFSACVDNDVQALSNECVLGSNSVTEQVNVKFVYDGDTLLVTDDEGNNKRKIRIIGIDTPEVKHHQQKAQVFGAKAREQLRSLLKKYDSRIVLEYDETRYDRYKRTLAHVFLEDGTNISEWLLQQGYAKTLVFPPNIKHVNCYRRVERIAQRNKLKLWKLKNNQLKSLDDLKKSSKGYIRLIGKVAKVSNKRKSVYLEFEKDSENSKRRSNVTIRVRIKKKNLRYFKAYSPEKLAGESIIVSGFIKNKNGKKTITLSHESQLDLLTEDVVNNTSEKQLYRR